MDQTFRTVLEKSSKVSLRSEKDKPTQPKTTNGRIKKKEPGTKLGTHCYDAIMYDSPVLINMII